MAAERGDSNGRDELFAEARRHLMRLLELEPDRTTALGLFGFIAASRGDWNEAEEALADCVRINPSATRCHFHLGVSYLLQGRCKDAMAPLYRAAKDREDPVALDAQAKLRQAHEQCAKEDGAVVLLLEAMKDRPGDPRLHFELGNLYAERGLLDRARDEWRNTLHLDSKHCGAHKQLARLADQQLDTEATIHHCRAFLECSRDKPPQPQRDRCQSLLRLR